MSALIYLLTRPEPVTFDELSAELRPVLPLLGELPHTPQDPEWHAEGDVATHSALVLARAHELSEGLDPFDRAALLLAAALHDIGKALTTREEPEGAAGKYACGRASTRGGGGTISRTACSTPALLPG